MEDDFNQRIIEEFRANGGRVGGNFEGAPILLMHHVGRRSGQPRVTPVVYQKVDSGWAVFASYAGAPEHPAWYHNLVAAPDTTVEVGDETVAVHTREAVGAERDAIWDKQKQVMPGFAEYEQKAGERTIPVLIFEPR
jgi:deazaflavin-dependent oxidoreductase (nitroreductase family)